MTLNCPSVQHLRALESLLNSDADLSADLYDGHIAVGPDSEWRTP